MRRALRVMVMAVLACLLLASAAQAKNDPLGSGTTKLILDKSFLSYLAKNDLKLKAKAGAKRKGKTVLLPITGGTMDLPTGKGEIVQAGTLVVEGERGSVPLKRIAVKTKKTPLVAKVGGSQLKVASAKRISSKRQGFGSSFIATRLTLTAKVATRLDKKLRPQVPFQEGQALGSLTSTAQPALITIAEQGKATLAFDPAFVAKLDSRFVSLNPIAPAERQGTAFALPIAAGGSLAPDGSQGTLRTAGAIEFLQLGSGQVFFSELWLDLAANSVSAEVNVQPTPTFPGKIGRVGVFGYSPAAAGSDPRARTISVSGAPLALSAQAAASFNEAFAQGEGPAFAAGEAVGVFSFVAQGQ